MGIPGLFKTIRQNIKTLSIGMLNKRLTISFGLQLSNVSSYWALFKR